MKQIASIKPAGAWDLASATDSVALDAEDRNRRRVVLVGELGATYLLNLAKPVQLHDGDGLMLDDGSIVRVVGKPEPLVEVAVESAQELARLAWHLGNRHTDVQVIGERLRIRRDHVLEEMLQKLGATLTSIEAAFEPEGGAYAHGGQRHSHREHGQKADHDRDPGDADAHGKHRGA